jgi:hypothetical protein
MDGQKNRAVFAPDQRVGLQKEISDCMRGNLYDSYFLHYDPLMQANSKSMNLHICYASP